MKTFLPALAGIVILAAPLKADIFSDIIKSGLGDAAKQAAGRVAGAAVESGAGAAEAGIRKAGQNFVDKQESKSTEITGKVEIVQDIANNGSVDVKNDGVFTHGTIDVIGSKINGDFLVNQTSRINGNVEVNGGSLQIAGLQMENSKVNGGFTLVQDIQTGGLTVKDGAAVEIGTFKLLNSTLGSTVHAQQKVRVQNVTATNGGVFKAGTITIK